MSEFKMPPFTWDRHGITFQGTFGPVRIDGEFTCEELPEPKPGDTLLGIPIVVVDDQD